MGVGAYISGFEVCDYHTETAATAIDEAIQAQDFAVVRSMVFIGSVLYILGLLLTDISYTLVDPRVRFE